MLCDHYVSLFRGGDRSTVSIHCHSGQACQRSG